MRFELNLLGGTTEKRYRALSPDVDVFPWGSLELTGFSDEEITTARRLWVDLCMQEFSAAAKQGDILRLLLRATIPLDLCGVFTTFPLDELVHAELCARMAVELGGADALEYEPEALFPPPNQERGSPLLAATRAVLWDFCVAETFSHAILVSHQAGATQPLLREVWGRLARDEARHMQFGWTFLSWVMPELSPDEVAALRVTSASAIRAARSLDDKVRLLGPEAFSSVSVFGSHGRDAYLSLCASSLSTRVHERLAEFGMAP